jgi:hypothetical protein
MGYEKGILPSRRTAESSTRFCGSRTDKVTQEERINQTENSSISTNPQRQREHRDGGEAEIPAEDANGVAQILPDRPHDDCSEVLEFRGLSRFTPGGVILQALVNAQKHERGLGEYEFHHLSRISACLGTVKTVLAT